MPEIKKKLKKPKPQEKEGELSEEVLTSMIDQAIAKHGLTLTPEEKAQQVEVLKSVFLEGKRPFEAMKLPENVCNVLYKQGYDLYNLGLYQQANAVFRFLCLLDPGAPRYHLSLAATNHQLGKYEAAIVMYFAAYGLDEGSPIPLYYLSDCYMKLSQPEASYVMLKHAAKNCEGKPQYEQLKTRCYLTMKQLRKDYGIGKEEEEVEGAAKGEDIFSKLQSDAEKGKQNY